MTNLSPARLLYNQLEAWSQPNVSPATARDDVDLVAHRRCVQWLEQLERQILSAGPDAEEFLEAHVSWTRAVFNYPRDWSSVHAGTIDPDALKSLRMFFLTSKQQSVEVDQDRLDQLREYLEKVVSQADAEVVTGLDPKLAGVVAAAATHLLDVIGNLEVVGSVTFEEEYEKFLGKMSRVGLVSGGGSEPPSGFKKFMNGLFFPFVSNTAGAVAGGFIQSALM